MSETKWTYRPHEFDDWGVVKDSTGFTICQARSRTSDEELSQHRRDGTDPWAANAHLIAAAPELYEALEAAVRELEQAADALGRAGHIDHADDCRLRGKACREVLAKARGEVK